MTPDPVDDKELSVEDMLKLLRETDPDTVTPHPGPLRDLPDLPPRHPAHPHLRTPQFMLALDHLGQDEHGWTAHCPICTASSMTVRPDLQDAIWVFTCPDGCTHEEVVAWFDPEIRLYAQEEDDEAVRGWICLMLATDLDQYAALLAGRQVAAPALDQAWLKRFKKLGVINITMR